jgi:hypothetical protein
MGKKVQAAPALRTLSKECYCWNDMPTELLGRIFSELDDAGRY